jgi:hypothetical protein
MGLFENKKKLIIIAGVIASVALIIGLAVGIPLSQNKRNVSGLPKNTIIIDGYFNVNYD